MICVSAFAASDIQRWFGYPKAQTVIVKNALNDRFQHLNVIPKLEYRPVVFLSIGRLNAGKNIPAVAKGFAMFEQDHPGVAILKIAGTGPQESIIRELAATGKAIECMGEVPYSEIDKHMQEAHVVVTSSLAEAFGMTIIEAMMNAIPVLASAVGGMAELVTDGKQGWLVRGSSAEAWKGAFEKAYLEVTSNTCNYEQLRKNGRLHFLQNYLQNQQLTSLIQIITK